jgi:dynamin 1-like protein
MNDQVIGHINKIQEIFLKHRISDKIDLPQIVVIGSQSCGKSSLLELLIGEEFLPKGEGIVTRCPILVQMTRDKTLVRPRIRLGHLKDRVFDDFRSVRDELIAQTERLAGKNKGISMEPIIVKVESTQTLPLSFVDLPGLTRIPTNGQPENIEVLIQELNHKFVDDPNTIIVAISSANNDIANSESLKLAMKVDPEGQRTIGVISKMDLYEGSNKQIESLFSRKTLNLKLGFIAVTTKRLSPENERLFLEQYPALTPHTYGTDLLRNRMCDLLRARIASSIPLLRNSLHGVLKVKSSAA